MKKYYLQDKDEAYSKGCFIEWDREAKNFFVTEFDKDIHYKGKPVILNDNRPYIEIEGDELRDLQNEVYEYLNSKSVLNEQEDNLLERLEDALDK